MARTAAARIAEPAQMRIDMVRLSELQRWPQNPRGHNDQASLGESFDRFGFIDPVIIDERTGRIVAGHGRLEKLQEMKRAGAQPPGRIGTTKGDWLVPVIRGVSFKTEKDAEAYLLACNRIGDNSGWDDSLLAPMLAQHQQDIVGLGWDQSEIDELVAAAEAATAVDNVVVEQDVEQDAVPELPKKAITKPGDVWQLGKHRVLCGDCRTVRLPAGDRVNIAITSPPYASQRKYDESSGFKPVAPDAYVEWFDAVQSHVRSLLAPDGSWFLNIKEHCAEGARSLYVKELTIQHVRGWGWRFVDELCWVHHGFPGQVVDRFKNAWEPIFHFALQYPAKCRPQHVAYESDSVMQYDKDARQSMTGAGWQGAKDPERTPGLALPRNVLQLSNGATTSIKGHSATFPVQLPSFFIRAYSDPGDRVFDPFLGSGTTLIAAEQLGRVASGIEISPAYCDVIVQRWQNLTGKKAQRRKGSR